MKTSDRFNKAISALVKGFFNETLAKGDCTACAVGNIVAQNIGFKIDLNTMTRQENPNEHWFDGIMGNRKLSKKAKDNIKSTGYSLEEIIRIESAFESNTQIDLYQYSFKSKELIAQDQYNGLMAVLDVLCEIEGLDTKEYKDMFSYKCEDSKLIKV